MMDTTTTDSPRTLKSLTRGINKPTTRTGNNNNSATNISMIIGALILLFALLIGGINPAAAQSTTPTTVPEPSLPEAPVCQTKTSKTGTTDWLEIDGMSLNSSTSGNYNGCITPPLWLFTDPANANDPWHWLPMTRWTRVNDFFSTSEGGLLSAVNNVLNASYTTLVAMAFTLASFAWAITVWLVRMMVGAPTLAAEFMSRLYDSFYDYAGALFATGWIYLVITLAVMIAAWRIARGKTGREALRTIMGALLPLGLLAGLMTFHVDVEATYGTGTQTHQRVSGPEWLFATALKVSSYVAEPVADLTDYLTSDDWDAPEQLVTCDAYEAVLEGNFMRAWRTKGDHREATGPQAPGVGTDSQQAIGSAIYQWAETSDQLRMRLAMIVSRIWERSYAVGWGRAQFGDSTVARRAYCLIADWRSRDVTAIEQLAIWRETCFLGDIGVIKGGRGKQTTPLKFGDQMALTGCSVFPEIAEPPDVQIALATNTNPSLVSSISQSSDLRNWPGQFFSSLKGTFNFALDNQDAYYQAINGDQNRAAEIYASALFDPTSAVIDGDRFPLRAFHGVFAACDFTGWTPEEYHENYSDIVEVNENEPPLYPNHSASLVTTEDLGTVGVRIPAAAVIDGLSEDKGNVVRVDHRMWGLGYDGATGGRGQPNEIISPNACLAYLFGSGPNNMKFNDEDEIERIDDTTGIAEWPYESDTEGLGIHDGSGNYVDPNGFNYPGNGFRWAWEQYPPPQAWLDTGSNGSRDEYPGANNKYVINRLGRTPEEYTQSANVWAAGATLEDNNNVLPVREPSLSSARSGADVFQSIHGRARAESGLMAILAVLVAFAYLFALAGLSLGSALSILILALLISILPILLLISALPFESARALPKKMLKLGLGAAFSYSLFLLFVSLVLLITDLLLSVVSAVGVTSGEFWYTALLGAIPLIALYAVGSLGKQFGLNVTSAKGAFMFTSGMAMANIKEPNARAATRYGRMGAMALAGGTVGTAVQRGMGGAAARTMPRVGGRGGAGGGAAAAGAGGAVANAAGAAMGASPRRSRSASSAAADRATGRGNVDDSGSDVSEGPIVLSGNEEDADGRSWRARAAARIAPGEAQDSTGPGRMRRAASFVGRHKALTASAMLLPLGGVGAAGALYGGAKASRALGLHHIPRMMTGRRPTQTASQPNSGAWLKGQVRQTRQRVADRLDSGNVAGSAGSPEGPINVDQSGVPLTVGGQYVSYAPPSTWGGGAHSSHMVWHQTLGKEVDMSLGLCGAITSRGTTCMLPQTACLHHSNADRARAAGANLTEEQQAASRAELEQRRAQNAQDAALVDICGADMGGEAVCHAPAASCTRHRSRIDATKQV